MRKGIIFILFITFAICACLALGNNSPAPSGPKGFALIELFSSEGCSSCPPAEDVMHNIIQRSEKESLPVYVIEFHVDYWDYLGWKDTFAAHEYSQRQQDYGDHLKLNSIYTPQAIINGESEMVGSDEDKINAAVEKELQKPATVSIECKAYKTGNSKVVAEYTITGNFSGCDLNFAVVESNLTTYVKKGENAHKTLTHDNVARVFKSIKANSSNGKMELEVPHSDLANAKLICYLQNTINRSVAGATEVSIVK
ncbi:MAG TPA: DUF1223 domain-containing protein [Bacteroidia bacterium]|nr:DUF1223 domain-containing protein [Bacteroidia bacterium]